MNKPLRVLQVLTSMNRGGAETMVMNCYRAVDKSKVQFDFLVHRESKGDFDDEIESMGGVIYRAIPIRPWSYKNYFRWLDDFFKNHAHEYIAIHSHIQENSYFALTFAQKYGIKNRINTSHAAFDHSYKDVFRKYAKWYGRFTSFRKLACGKDAGKSLYGDNVQFEVLHNFLDIRKYTFNEEKRKRIRLEKNWKEDIIVIGHVGRIDKAKNQLFLIDIFQKFHEQCPNSILVLVGDGDYRTKAVEKVSRLQLENCVQFEGVRRNVQDYLFAFDLFVFPSIREGLPLSVIEAQAAGLQCILSDTVDHSVDVTGNVHFVSLYAELDIWCDQMRSLCHIPHKDTYEDIVKAGYDVHQNVKHLLGLYGVEKPSLADEELLHRPMVTVGLPVYNAENSVSPAIHSILSQTYGDFELIISDDGSTDESLAKIRQMDDPRIRIIEGKENRGIAYRINEQIEAARGVYFARMDADDLMLPNRLQRQVEVMEEHREIDVLGSSIVVMDEHQKILGSRSAVAGNKNLDSVSYLLHPTVMARTKWFRLHLYNPAYSGWEDYELWLRTRRFSNLSALSDPLLIYRDSSKFNVRKFIRRRMIGCKVVKNEWMLFDSPLTALCVLCSNLISCVIVPIVHGLHLDEWRTRKRNKMLTEDEKKQYECLMKKFIS